MTAYAKAYVRKCAGRRIFGAVEKGSVLYNEVYIPEVRGHLKKSIITLPEAIQGASGIRINGRVLRSFIFTTDVAAIRNNNADAVIAVYPFLPQPIITQAVISVADVPVFCGIGSGTGAGGIKRIVNLAKHAEYQGAQGVVVSANISNDAVHEIATAIDIPVILTVISENTDFKARLEAGASILNVSGADNTPDIIRMIRSEYPYVPIIATGGPSDDTIRETIAAGANAITYTPPTSGNIFAEKANRSRELEKNKDN